MAPALGHVFEQARTQTSFEQVSLLGQATGGDQSLQPFACGAQVWI